MDRFQGAVARSRCSAQRATLSTFLRQPLARLPTPLKGESNILAYAQKCIGQGIVLEAFDFLTSIRGIGPKIASLFLRDAKELLLEGGASVQIDGSIRWQLQPIDIWVKRTIELIAGRRMESGEAAKFIVQNSPNPERANMGIWYFSSQVSGSQYRHNLCLRAIPDAENQLKKFIRSKNFQVLL